MALLALKTICFAVQSPGMYTNIPSIRPDDSEMNESV